MVIILDEKTIQEKINELYKMNVYIGIVDKTYYLCSSFRREDMTSIRLNNEILSVIKFIKKNLLINISMVKLTSVLIKLGLAKLYVSMKNSGLINIYDNINDYRLKSDSRLHMVITNTVSMSINTVMRGRKYIVNVYVDDIMREMIDELYSVFDSVSELFGVSILYSLYELKDISELNLAGVIDNIIVYKVIIDKYFKFMCDVFNQFKKMGLTVGGDK